MAKALVIKNVNFSANALDQVELIEEIPCTGITLSKSTESITSLEPITLVATVIPATTTDVVIWSSSDNSVATVVNGVVTPKKTGTATITATCGTYSASCTVDIRVYLNINFAQHYYFQKKTSSAGDSVELGGGPSKTTYGFSNVNNSQTGNNRYAYVASSTTYEGENVYPIKIPEGMTGLAFSVPNSAMKISPYWANSGAESGYGQRTVLFISSEADSPWGSGIPSGSRSVSVPGAGEDSFFISVYIPSASGAITQEMLDAITVEVLYDTVT